MNAALPGAGHSGLAKAACLAEVGNDVLCVDTHVTRTRFMNDIANIAGHSSGPVTDDMREASALVATADLVAHKAETHCDDPQAMTQARHLLFSPGDGVSFASSAEEPPRRADAPWVVMQWKQFLLSSFDVLLQLRDRLFSMGATCTTRQRLNPVALPAMALTGAAL